MLKHFVVRSFPLTLSFCFSLAFVFVVVPVLMNHRATRCLQSTFEICARNFPFMFHIRRQSEHRGEVLLRGAFYAMLTFESIDKHMNMFVCMYAIVNNLYAYSMYIHTYVCLLYAYDFCYAG